MFDGVCPYQENPLQLKSKVCLLNLNLNFSFIWKNGETPTNINQQNFALCGRTEFNDYSMNSKEDNVDSNIYDGRDTFSRY